MKPIQGENTEISNFVGWAQDHLDSQTEPFRSRFRPALEGLHSAAEGRWIDSTDNSHLNGRRFLGWSNSAHWLDHG